jgi:hypothetical protein
VAKPVGLEKGPKLDRRLLRSEGDIRADLRQQLIDIDSRWESWKRKTDDTNV